MNIQEVTRKAISKVDPPTAYQLGKVLQLKQISQVYKWLAGTGKPGPERLLRIVEIAQGKRMRGGATPLAQMTILTASAILWAAEQVGRLYIMSHRDEPAL